MKHNRKRNVVSLTHSKETRPFRGKINIQANNRDCSLRAHPLPKLPSDISTLLTLGKNLLAAVSVAYDFLSPRESC